MQFVCIIVIIAFMALFIYIRINKAQIIGYWGEKKVSTVLSFLGNEYIVFNNVIVTTTYGSSQIDHIVVSPYGIFVIETKNYKGWITGSKNSEKWTQNIWGHKYQLINPIHQNLGHIQSLKKVLPQFVSNQYISLVVFTHKSSLKLTDCSNVIHTWQLLYKIHSYKDVVLYAEQQQEYIQGLQQYIVTTKANEHEHILKVKQNISNYNKAVHSGICPHCGGTLIKRRGQYGSFYGCSNYPKCRYILNIK